MHMEEELANQFLIVKQVYKKMKHYVIHHAELDIMVLDLYVGKTVPQDLLLEELIAIKRNLTEEEQDMRYGIKKM